MAKLIFRYGAMGSSKTANALMVRYNYVEKGKKVILLKPKCEDRDGAKIIKSRIGLEEPCEFAEDFLEQYKGEHYDCIIVDEATMATTREGVYAAGDAVSGAATVILAMGGGKEAAASIDKYIQNKAK